ncbi:MAG: YdhR family protein [Caldilineaceae bacterium]
MTLSSREFDVIEDATQVTHGPVGTIMAATSGPVGKVLQIHFQYDITSDEYRAAATSLADTFAQLDGLRWKIWTLNEETGEAGGIFLFDDEPSRQGYLDGLYAEVIGGNPAFHDSVIQEVRRHRRRHPGDTRTRQHGHGVDCGFLKDKGQVQPPRDGGWTCLFAAEEILILPEIA